jgi:hypothetical protein
MRAYRSSLSFLRLSFEVWLTQKRTEIDQSRFTDAFLPVSKVYSKLNTPDEFDLQWLDFFFAELVVDDQSDRYFFVDSVVVSLCFNHEQTYAGWNQSRRFALISGLGWRSEHFSFCDLSERSPDLDLAELIGANKHNGLLLSQNCCIRVVCVSCESSNL